MIIAAAILTAAISLDLNLSSLLPSAEKGAPVVTCGIRTVAYRFRGAPGQQFRYAGETHVVPARGSIELLASQHHTTYLLANASLPMDGPATDEFGVREVQIPIGVTQIHNLNRTAGAGK